MVTDKIIDILISPVYWLLQLLSIPIVDNLVIPDDTFDTISMIVVNVGYVLPMDLIVSCLIFSFALDNFHIIWTLFIRLRSFVPKFG